jgi:hypothetical protein
VDGDDRPDRAAQERDRSGAGPGDLAGAPVGADHGDDCRAEAAEERSLGLGEREWRGAEQTTAPSPRNKAKARNTIDQLIASLSGVDAAYTPRNTNESRSNFEEATFSWSKVSAAIAKREAREPKLLLNSLDSKLRSGAPAAQAPFTLCWRS